MGGKEDDDLCGYGSIFIFAGQGSINQMIKVVEFCGSKDSPIIDFQNKNYLGIQGKKFEIFPALKFVTLQAIQLKPTRLVIKNCFFAQSLKRTLSFEDRVWPV